MPTATMTSKGQITVPSEVRADLRLQTGDRVRFEKGANGVYELRPVKGSIMRLAGIFKHDGPPMSLDDIDQAIGEAVTEADRRTRR